MSIKAMTEVWKNSPSDGANLLILLVLADYADDDGVAHGPNLEDVRAKARLSTAGLQMSIGTLIARGELQVVRGGGYSGEDLYQLNTNVGVTA